MKTSYDKIGVTDKVVGLCLSIILKEEDNEKGRKKIFNKIKKTKKPERAVGYYIAARINGDPVLAAVARDRAFAIACSK